MKETPIRARRLAVVVAATAVMSVAGTVAAQAQTARQVDPAHDVVSWTFPSDPDARQATHAAPAQNLVADRSAPARVVQVQTSDDDITTALAPTRKNGDITKITVWNHVTVGVRVRFRDLKRSGIHSQSVHFVTRRGLERDLYGFAGPGSWTPQAVLVGPNGEESRCKVSATFDYVTNTATYRVPRHCLGDPLWVRVGFTAVTGSLVDSDDTPRLFVDDAYAGSDSLLDLPDEDSDAYPYGLSPKVHHS